MAKSGGLHVPEVSTDDTLHTPHILPHEENPINETQSIFNISRVPSLDEDLLKLGGSREGVGGEILDKLCGKDSHGSLDSTFSISRVPSIDEDLLIIANDDSDSDGDNISSKKSREAQQQTETNKALKLKLKESVQNRLKSGKNHTLKLLDSGQGIIIAPITIDKIKNAESATLLINQKVDPFCMRVPRKRIAKQSAETLKKSKNFQEEVSSDKEKVRAMNRAAQSRSRSRKKKWINEMVKKIEELTKENKNLLALNEQLQNEISLVRNILQFHNECSATKDPQISMFNIEKVSVVTIFMYFFLEEKTDRLISTAKQKLKLSSKKSVVAETKGQIPIRPAPVLPATPVKLQVPVVQTIPNNVQVCVVPALNSFPLLQMSAVSVDGTMKTVLPK